MDRLVAPLIAFLSLHAFPLRVGDSLVATVLRALIGILTFFASHRRPHAIRVIADLTYLVSAHHQQFARHVPSFKTVHSVGTILAHRTCERQHAVA